MSKIEKYIQKVKTKDSFSLSVIIPVDGKAKRFGTFKRSDYDSDRSVREAARECRDKALMDRRQNKVVLHDLTVREAYQKSLDLFVANVKTRERHEVTFQNLIPENVKNKPISKVTAAEIQLMINKYAQTHSSDSLSRTKTLWKQIYKAAAMSGCPVYDQSQMVIMPKAKKPLASHAKHCTVEELEEFLEGLRDYNSFLPEGRKLSRDVELAIRVMQYVGIRPQEVFALCSEDIDLKNDILYIRHSIGSTDTGKRQLIATKTEESVRMIPIPDALVPFLEEMLTHDTRPLLCDIDGLPYDTTKISVLMCNVSKSKKCPHINQYMLRHMFGTDMAKKDVKIAQTLMGHESAKMTLGYAKKASMDDMRDALNKRYS